jgi:hypothetical protein
MDNLRGNLHVHQFRIASGILNGFHRVFRSEAAHHQREFAVRGRLNGRPIDALDVLRGARAAAVDFHNELGVFRADSGFHVFHSFAVKG